MSGITGYAIEGTAALKQTAGSPCISPRDLEVVGIGVRAPRGESDTKLFAQPHTVIEHASALIWKALRSSEMYCSLRLEDYRGCPYGVFSKEGITVLSTLSACVAVLSIAFGC